MKVADLSAVSRLWTQIKAYIDNALAGKLDADGDNADSVFTLNAGDMLLVGNSVTVVSAGLTIDGNDTSGGTPVPSGIVTGLAEPASASDAATKSYVDDTVNEGMDAVLTATEGYTDEAVSSKQDRLISGTTIKTVNSTSLLGGGNIPAVQGDYLPNSHTVELEQGTDAITFTQTADGLEVTASDGSADFIDRELVSKSYVAQYQTQAQVEALILDELSRFDKLDYEIVTTLPATGTAGVRYLIKQPNDDRYEEYIYVNGAWYDIGATDEVNLADYYTKQEEDLLLDAKADTTDLPTLTSELTNDGDGTHNFVTFGDAATSSAYGVVKLNPNQNITLNASGQLEVGGRIGQFEGTTGLFAPNDRQPRQVLDYSFLVTDALGMRIGNRAFADVSGYGITVRSASPGTTVYYAENTYANRIVAKTCENGFVSKDEATSKVEMTIPVVSVLINGQTFTPDSSPDDPDNPIVITLESSANPDTTITQLRMFGQMISYATAHIGNGIHSDGGGRNLLVGGALSKYGSSNDNCMVGMQIYSSGNGNGIFGRNHIAIKNRGFLAGTGHDTTNARGEGVSAVGQYSLLDSNTLFAVGNGTSHTDRVNAFEVNVKNGGTAKVNFIEANNGKLEFADTQDIAPEVNAGNWGLGTGGSIADYDGTPGFATTDVKGTAVNITAATGAVKQVAAGETLQWSFQARKKVGSETGKLQLNLLKCNATGGSTSNNVVHDGTAASYTTEWVTYSGTFTVPSGMEYVRPRFSRTNTGAGSAGGYEIKDFSLIQSIDSGIVLKSPNGVRWKIGVDDSGNLTTTAVV